MEFTFMDAPYELDLTQDTFDPVVLKILKKK